MMLFKNMEDFEAIHVIQNDTLVVQLPNGIYDLDGEEIKLNRQDQIIVPAVGNLSKITTEYVVSHYLRKYKDGSADEIPKEEGDKLLEDMQANINKLSVNDRTLEKEIELLKLRDELSRFNTVKSTVKRLDPVNFNVVVRVEEIPSKFIETAIGYGSLTWSTRNANPPMLYKVHSSDIAIDEMKKLAEEDKTIIVKHPDSSGIRYSQIGAEYVFNSNCYSYISKLRQTNVCYTLEEANKFEESVRQYVRDAVNLIKNKNHQINELNCGNLLTTLKSIKSNLVKIDPKMNSSSSHSAALSSLSKLIISVTKEISDL